MLFSSSPPSILGIPTTTKTTTTTTTTTKRSNGKRNNSPVGRMGERSMLAALLLLLCLMTTMIPTASAADDVAAAAAGAARAAGADAEQGLVDWLLENDGVFSDKVEFRHLDPNDESSPNGLFAKADLKVNETIMVIPHKCLLKSVHICGLTRYLASQYRLGEQSFYKDYVRYLFDGNKRRKLPERWSSEAQEILDHLVGEELVGSPFIGRSFQSMCHHDDEDHGDGIMEPIHHHPAERELLEDSLDLVVSRSWNEVMIPVYDMVNHRNGHWRNVEATSAHIPGQDVTVYAYRDIQAGEQLFLSYNDCLDTDCEGLFEASYGTIAILVDYGFVEEYPQRWFWEGLPNLDAREDEGPPMVLEIDRVPLVAASPPDPTKDPTGPTAATEQFQVKWHTDARPDLQMINFLSGHLRMLETTTMHDYVQESTEDLISDHERYTLRQLYQSLLVALQYTIWSFYDQAIDALAGANQSSAITHRHYDSLERRPVIGNPEGKSLQVCHPTHFKMGPDYEMFFETESQYQTIEFTYGEEEDDTCLFLSGWGQTCTSFRQYHEALVHYPASFLPEIKRVAFIGGGDNMILHEILKYPSIELVVGLELDQAVVRYSFLNMGTLPYFDDPRVQWWFGDATKSLLMLPQDYFGSFDLVLVDLQTFVADSLFVTDHLSIMDTMKLLLKPDTGIMSKNEDFPNRKITDFARYTVDMEYCDLPQICRQSITIGSNGINFLTAPQYKHDIETIYMKESLSPEGKFDNWYNFRDNHASSDTSNSTSGGTRTSTATATAKNGGSDASDPSAFLNCHGVLVVVDAEELSNDNIKTKEEFTTALTTTLTAYGMEVLAVDSWTQNTHEHYFDVVLTFRQGYLIVRKGPTVDNFVAMDIVLWDGIDNINLLKTSLIESIGGDEKKSSSHRLVTGGIRGVSGEPYILHYTFGKDETCNNPDAADTAEAPDEFSFAWKEFASLIPGEETSIVVLCGSAGSACTSWDVLKASPSITAIALHSCEGVSDVSNDETLFNCEVEMVKTLHNSLSNKINGIWLDTTASRSMAKVLLRLLTSLGGRADLLNNNNYTVLTQLNGEEWREGFVERFRTEVSPFAPAKEARFSFTSDIVFNLFSAGDDKFYGSLVKFMEELGSKSQLTKPSVDAVLSGEAPYVPHFDPEFFNNQAYDNSRAYAQWRSQQPVGSQTILQLELKAPKTPLVVGEGVLFQYDDHVWFGMWAGATVLRQNEDGSYDIQTGKSRIKTSIPRDALRRLDFDTTNDPFHAIDVGTRVIYQGNDEEIEWMQGFVVSRSDDSKNYQVREYQGDGSVVQIDAEKLMPQFESTHVEALPTLSLTLLEKVFRKALTNGVGLDNSPGLELQGHGIGDGCVITALWDLGNAVLVWDGDKHIDINIFFDYDDPNITNAVLTTFEKKIPFLASITRDEQPRGYGGVINFRSEINLNEDPLWWPDDE